MDCPHDARRCRCLLWRVCPDRVAYDLHRRPGSLAGPADRPGASLPDATATDTTADDLGKPAPIPGSGSALGTNLKE